MIQGRLIPGSYDLKEVFDIRRKVFIEEQGIPEEDEFDEQDREAMHAVAYVLTNQREMDSLSTQKEMESTSTVMQDKIAVATGRILFDGEECKISRIAVLKEYRGKRYGDFIVRLLINKAFTSGINRITLNSQLNAIDFYRKIGFQQEGEEFLEAGILHCRMKIEQKDLVFSCRK